MEGLEETSSDNVSSASVSEEEPPPVRMEKTERKQEKPVAITEMNPEEDPKYAKAEKEIEESFTIGYVDVQMNKLENEVKKELSDSGLTDKEIKDYELISFAVEEPNKPGRWLVGGSGEFLQDSTIAKEFQLTDQEKAEVEAMCARRTEIDRQEMSILVSPTN